MWMVGLGVVLTALKFFGLGFVAGWSWWVVLAPFAMAAAWWKFADATGITQRQAMQREDERAAQRREAQFEALGMRAPRTHGPGPRTRAEGEGEARRGDRQ